VLFSIHYVAFQPSQTKKVEGIDKNSFMPILCSWDRAS